CLLHKLTRPNSCTLVMNTLTPPLYIPFSLYGPGPHPDPHSFPTRRSSDLVGGSASPEQIENAFRILSSDPSVKAIFINVRMRKADRKSTRLNSSHVAISYAVFCLKKKKVD